MRQKDDQIILSLFAFLYLTLLPLQRILDIVQLRLDRLQLRNQMDRFLRTGDKLPDLFFDVFQIRYHF